jgi:phosphomannomutase / phosphoglucomutase
VNSADKILPVILAGGGGTRLWPVSRENSPKQFQPLTGALSTYQLTLRRASDAELFLPPMVITGARDRFIARRMAAEVGAAPTIVAEPMRRDSAAAMAVAAVLAERASPGGVVLALAADHLIGDTGLFLDAVCVGSAAAREGYIVVFGLAPTAPLTSYGYIRPGAPLHGGDDLRRVEAFVEKPDVGGAKAYVAAGYLWNSGNFLFRSDVMVREFELHAPDILVAARDALAGATEDNDIVSLERQAFGRARRTSIDYAVIEKSRDIAVVKGHFPWSDVGSWAAVADTMPKDGAGNAVYGKGFLRDSRNCLIHSGPMLTAAVGVDGLAIIATADAVLVIPKSRSQEVKSIVEDLQARAAPDAEGGARDLPKFPVPAAALRPNTLEFETAPLIKPTGFREYDARWWFGHGGSPVPPELNPMGVQALGMGLGTLLHERGVEPQVVTGHDYRSYSMAIKLALTQGLMAAGCLVHDIGLALTPMAYFAQFALDVPAVAMVTASHNENGWTGVKMGCERPLTFGPDEMARLRDIVIGGHSVLRDGGGYRFVENFAARYFADMTARARFKRRMKAVVACGNGTAGAFVPDILAALGADVVPLHTDLDHSFPNYNPNPEDMTMLHDIAAAATAHGADVGLGFDGDGDRCGIVDNEGHEIFADKIGVMLARDLSALHPNARFVVDVKSTGLFGSDPVLKANGACTDYFKTGHSHIKRRVKDLGALAGFEKSGHFFFNGPLGRGYDDGVVAAIAVLDMLDRNPAKSMADLYRALPKTWGSPTMSAPCADEVKYDVVARVTKRFQAMTASGAWAGGQAITGLLTVNGVRVTTRDGTWGLVRASSNKPELVVVIESPRSQARLHEMFKAVDAVLRENPEVGAYNQTL